MTFVQCTHGGHKAKRFTAVSLVRAPTLRINRGFKLQHHGNQYDMLHCNMSMSGATTLPRKI